MANLDDMKQDVFEYAGALLGEGMIDLSLDPIHYETAYKRAVGK